MGWRLHSNTVGFQDSAQWHFTLLFCPHRFRLNFLKCVALVFYPQRVFFYIWVAVTQATCLSLFPQVPYVQEEPDYRFPLPHHHLLCSKLPRCLQQQRSDTHTHAQMHKCGFELCAPLRDVAHPDMTAFGPLVSLDFPRQVQGIRNKCGLVSRRQAPPLLPVASGPEGQKWIWSSNDNRTIKQREIFFALLWTWLMNYHGSQFLLCGCNKTGGS